VGQLYEAIHRVEKVASVKGAEAKELQCKIEMLEKAVMESEYTSKLVPGKRKVEKRKLRRNKVISSQQTVTFL
jgi:hypothetical protein